MRIFFLLILICIPVALSGQASFSDDTIRISEVIVQSSSKSSVLNGFRDQKLDSTVLKDYQLYDISSLISENTPLFVKNYGPGAIATTSFRGTGANHTQLLWNDISINSPMLGQADLSIVPVGFTDEVRVLSGAASMIMGSGGLGGSVNLETKPDWKNETNLFFNAGAGSFGTYSGLVRLRTGTDRFQSVTRGFIHRSENNFRYLNDAGFSAPIVERRANASVTMHDLMQEFYFRGDKSVTSANVWYSYSDRQLPSNMLVVQPAGSENQNDESLRAIISHDRSIRNTSLESSIAWFSDRLLYINKQASINSRNQCNTLFFRAGFESPLGAMSRIKFVLNNELNMVNSVNYSDFKKRNVSTLSVTDRTILGKNLGFSVLVREIIDNGKFLYPDFSTGLDYRLSQEKDAFIRLNLSRNSKVPSLNDLFWNPGGNPDLKNEYSYSGELSFDIRGRVTAKVEFDPELTFYTSAINDMIQWVPSEYSYWTPQNISKVNTSGAEATLAVAIKTGNMLAKLKLQYSFNRARSTGKNDINGYNQLIYVPENQFTAIVRLEHRRFYTTFITDLTGKRYTEQDNSKYLPAYVLNNLMAGFIIKPGASTLNICVKSENIFNVHYQAIAFYPMPGRSFMFSLIYQFTKPL